jgi:acyl carrier protein
MTDKKNWDISEIQKIVFKAVAEAAGSEIDELTADTELLTKLNMDSLAIFELAIELEEAFELRIPDEDIDDIKTIGDVIDYIDSRIS